MNRAKKTKYYIDSSTHRNKERCFQYILLILLQDNFYMKMTLPQSRDICQDLISSLINDEQSNISALQQICIALMLNFALSHGEDFLVRVRFASCTLIGSVITKILVGLFRSPACSLPVSYSLKPRP